MFVAPYLTCGCIYATDTSGLLPFDFSCCYSPKTTMAGTPGSAKIGTTFGRFKRARSEIPRSTFACQDE
jgi:hypothetical protein